MQLVCITWFGTVLVTASWFCVCSGEKTENSEKYGVLHPNGKFSKDANIVDALTSNLASKRLDERLQQGPLSLGDKNVTVPLNEVHGDEQNHTHLSSTERLSSTSSQTYSMEVGNNASGASVLNNFVVNNDIKVPSNVHVKEPKLMRNPYGTSISADRKPKTSQELENTHNSTTLQADANSLPKVLDPSFKSLAAISRRANSRRSSRNHPHNHERKKRSSFTLDNIDIGDEKYLKNIIVVEKPQYEYRNIEYRRPWRIAESERSPIEKKNSYHSKKDYLKYQHKDGIASSVSVSRKYIPGQSSSENEYHEHESSYYPVSPSFVSDVSLPAVNSISSPESYSSSNLDSKEGISSSASKRFDSENLVSYKSPHKNSDHHQLHKEHNHYQHQNIYNNFKAKNNINLKEGELKKIQPVVVQSLSRPEKLSVNDITPYGQKDKSYSNYNPNVVYPSLSLPNKKRLLQRANDGAQPRVGQLDSAEEPLVMASSSQRQHQRLTSSNQGGEVEKLPPATSNIIDAGKGLVRNIMKRRTKTGRYDVPQVGK